MCSDILILLYYISQKTHSKYIVNVDIMLGQRCKNDRPTLAQCFPNVGPVVANNGPTLNKYWVRVLADDDSALGLC